jgi:hypothetical protein
MLHGPVKRCYPTTTIHDVTTQKTWTWTGNMSNVYRTSVHRSQLSTRCPLMHVPVYHRLHKSGNIILRTIRSYINSISITVPYIRYFTQTHLHSLHIVENSKACIQVAFSIASVHKSHEILWTKDWKMKILLLYVCTVAGGWSFISYTLCHMLLGWSGQGKERYGSRNTHRGDEEYMQSFYRKTWREETTRKT